MRLIDFAGIAPKIHRRKLGQALSQRAVNVDLYGARLQGLPSPRIIGNVVDVNGNPIEGDVGAMHIAGDMVIGFKEHTFVAPDPSKRFGRDTFLFVQDGKLYRTSPSQILNHCPPTLVGIDAPCKAPVAGILPSQGCKTEQIPDMCAQRDETGCDDYAPPQATSYRFTYVNACGEESAPSNASEIIDVYNGDGVALSDPNTPPENAVARRWYRSVVGSKGELVWLFVEEIAIVQAGYIDGKCSFELGEELSTDEHEPPPECIKGVAAFGDTATVVWTTRNLYFSEPMLPNAYKRRNCFTVLYDIVGVQHYIDNVEAEHTYKLAVMTDGKPYVVYGYLPDNATVRELQDWQPCVSARSICVGEGLVYYASTQGVVMFTGSNAKVITADYMTEIEWLETRPDTNKMCYWSSRLWGFHDKGGYQIRVSNSDVDRVEHFTEHDFIATACAASADTAMYVTGGESPVAQLWRWCDNINERMVYTWYSRVETQSVLWYPVSIKIEAERGFRMRVSEEAQNAYDLWKIEHRGSMADFSCTYPEFVEFLPALESMSPAIKLQVYADDELMYERIVRRNTPIRLPRVRRALHWAVRVTSAVEIIEIHMQTSNEDLSQEGGAV